MCATTPRWLTFTWLATTATGASLATRGPRPKTSSSIRRSITFTRESQPWQTSRGKVNFRTFQFLAAWRTLVKGDRAVVVAQLVKRSLQTSEILGSNPGIGEFYLNKSVLTAETKKLSSWTEKVSERADSVAHLLMIKSSMPAAKVINALRS